MEPSTETVVELPEGWLGAALLEIDIGCHKGTFLAAMAQLYPERNFLGIELQSSRVERTRKKIERMGLANARVVQGEGLAAMRSLPPGCADFIHVLFPDPWPKRRHHIRRLVQAEFLVACARALKPGGILRLVTDDENYAISMREVAAGAKDFRQIKSDGREYPPTEFQKKFVGLPIYHLPLAKV